MKHQGKLIVIEGGDGSGKTTQANLLLNYLEQQNIPHSSLDFPQYDSFYGEIVAKFLRGEFGELNSVSPYLVALTFALDRYSVKDEIIERLNRGEIIIANRYVTSNIAHQGSKFEDKSKRDAFISWLDELEYTVHGLPREDIVLHLHVPTEITAKLTEMKDERSYLQGKKDIQEQDKRHQNSTEMMYNILSQQYKHWISIPCFKNGTMNSKEEIHKNIVRTLIKKGIVK
ncbi:thymidylate kinase [Candidatus Roizmanbacteria bacterium CG_4_10_14_0_2_um_filter_39_13]|uniref:Thymidylate kinase n=1 Tax=Candidatus Roizmanbacteria bacterium CG_4_10_14_0_2_um_filter_39_13 TaxID=1974825 RepID=A0A2M7U033_9BACT|nr:MAG: thymidylate kinase [Candidatus Roizmanbacteria bacterium CG_4_10_14_0_2_um_filter_39_13]